MHCLRRHTVWVAQHLCKAMAMQGKPPCRRQHAIICALGVEGLLVLVCSDFAGGIRVCVCVCHVGVRPRLGCCSSAFGWQQCVMYVSAARPHTCKHGSMHLSCRDYGRQGGWCTRYWWLVHVVLVCNWAVSRGRKTLKVFRPQACAAVSVGIMKVLDW